MENSRFKFRAWDKEEQKFHYDTIAGHRDGSVFIGHIGYFQGTLEQFTGLHDKNGKEIYEGDKVNIFFTSYNKEHIHDCIYSVSIRPYGVVFTFKSLLWESHGHNQCPIENDLKFGTHTEFYNDVPHIKDTYGENTLRREKWKIYDDSDFFEVIGTIHDSEA